MIAPSVAKYNVIYEGASRDRFKPLGPRGKGSDLHHADCLHHNARCLESL
jgi:hypothetical protein